MHSEKFFNAASAIQKIARGRLCRDYYQYLRGCVIRIQSVVRSWIAKHHAERQHLENAAVMIQCVSRNFVSRMNVFELQLARSTATIIIKRAYRNSQYIELEPPEPEVPSEDDVLRAVIAVQSMYRGGKAMTELFEAANAPPTPEPKPMPEPEPSPEVLRHIESPKNAIAATPPVPVQLPVREKQITPVVESP
jgi:hypothetical protein